MDIKLKEYKAPKPTAIEKFLWWCCGADKQILVHATYADYAKFSGLGGVVLATGVLAFLSMTFAMSRIFEETNVSVHIIVGIIWGLIIFNLDRFIVSSTGKGDGKHDISSSEFKHAIPRLIMATLIGITISAPLEVYIFQKEIDKQWEVNVNNERTKARETAEKDFVDKSKKNVELVDVLATRIASKEVEVLDASRRLAEEQSDGGRGPETKDWERREERLKSELQLLTDEKRELDAFTSQKDSLIRLAQDKAEFKERGWSSDQIEKVLKGEISKDKLPNKLGLLDSITALHEYPGSSIPSWLVRLLFVFIEIAPVFFKLMLAFSPYDYLSDNVKFKILAANGIGVRDGYTKLDKGEIYDKVTYHEADYLFKEREDKISADYEIYKDIIEKYKIIERDKVESKPDDFISKDDTLKEV
jgi:hypothetical protein